MGDDQRPGRDAGHGEDPGAWLVEGGGGVLGQARIAHQHGDEGVRRGGAGGARQHQGVGVVVLGQKDVVGAASIGDDGGDMVVRRPGQGDRSQRLGGDAGSAEPQHAHPGSGRRLPRRAVSNALAATPSLPITITSWRIRRATALGGALLQHRADGEDRRPEGGDQRRPAADQEAPVGIAGMALVGVAGDIEQSYRAIGRFVEPIAVGEPAPHAQPQGHDHERGDRPSRAQGAQAAASAHERRSATAGRRSLFASAGDVIALHFRIRMQIFDTITISSSTAGGGGPPGARASGGGGGVRRRRPGGSRGARLGDGLITSLSLTGTTGTPTALRPQAYVGASRRGRAFSRAGVDDAAHLPPQQRRQGRRSAARGKCSALCHAETKEGCSTSADIALRAAEGKVGGRMDFQLSLVDL
jgi:hypothetical protein